MYVQKVELENIRSIKKLEMNFPNPAGWHVIIGDNGSGKSSILRAISLCLIGPRDIQPLWLLFINWIKKDAQDGRIKANVTFNPKFDHSPLSQSTPLPRFIETQILIEKEKDGRGVEIGRVKDNTNVNPTIFIWGNYAGWFSSAFGPYRRFSGGNPENDQIFENFPRLGAHLSLFGEDIALTAALEWIKELDYKRLKESEKPHNGKENTIAYHNLIRFINESKLLPHGASIKEVDKDGILFQDGNNNPIPILELSDGYRSILSLTFELIRQLVRVYGAQAVFADIEKGKMEINLPGVVLIDEIDAHLHPSWQVDVGFWFTKYFPQLQFIVTTHSPLVCRAAEKGSIWRLAKPGTDSQAEEITGVEKERLIYGNILDAYGTELFGENTVRSKKSKQKLDRLGRLNMLYAIGKIKPEEEKERLKLQKILSTDDPTGF